MTGNPEQFTVEQSQPGARLDGFLRARFAGTSRSGWQRLIEEGAVLVNGRPVKPAHVPRAGEEIRIQPPEIRPAQARPEAIPLVILFEDAHLLVVDKPAGLVVHPAAGHPDGTLVNALLHHCAGSLSGLGGEARPGIVHRLDKETSGCLVVAKDDPTHAALSAQFAAREVGKQYLAIVCGRLTAPAGDIREPIARHPVERQRMAASPPGRGRAAHTTYRVLATLAQASLVAAQIHTGRTHQVRVHFQFLGHPLAGDQTYGARANKKLMEATGFKAPRVMLHAHELAFTHPGTRERMTFRAPVPADFGAALRALGLAPGRIKSLKLQPLKTSGGVAGRRR